MTAAEGGRGTAEDVEALRSEIDRLDECVRDLLLERRDLSRRIQALRAGAGNAGVQPSREAAVIAGYVDVLDEHGRHVAEAVLRLCRGAVDDER